MDIIQLHPHHIGVPEIIEEIDHLMNSLYSEDSNDLLPLGALNSENVYFAGVYSSYLKMLGSARIAWFSGKALI